MVLGGCIVLALAFQRLHPRCSVSPDEVQHLQIDVECIFHSVDIGLYLEQAKQSRHANQTERTESAKTTLRRGIRILK